MACRSTSGKSDDLVILVDKPLRGPVDGSACYGSTPPLESIRPATEIGGAVHDTATYCHHGWSPLAMEGTEMVLEDPSSGLCDVGFAELLCGQFRRRMTKLCCV